MFRLCDKEMYTSMEAWNQSDIVARGMALHKLLRLLTMSLGGEGYLTFMGNEFGHPEWIDFPREGNGWSYHYARRQWSLVQSSAYKYEWLANFDRDMTEFLRTYGVLKEEKPLPLFLDGEKKVAVFRRGELIYVFNLHPTRSDKDIFVNCADFGEGEYGVVFSSDLPSHGGQNRISLGQTYRPTEEEYGFGFRVYLPCRTALVLKKK
jgi:1,4-alpha-glucan branching enzyme